MSNIIERCTNRLTEILQKKEMVHLKHTNGLQEDLIVGIMHDCVYVYDTSPDLIRAFEIEGGPGSRDLNIRNAAEWLYHRSFESKITR